ncbi:2-hydroxyacid dehydrogenase, putative [Babesia ovata]|uniref:2-hydroxyacid dehydrogenase, putative n=1 Tax=Babesia ovata TaxID=189622 RepID=A0A2H6KHM9_9APIC|nr:2-hydroxyacid dehydrogenase, putative [Babesia ovata]GBE62481.1 2-hydroxyacid dehydrogenase, putative [Babesia ovata]
MPDSWAVPCVVDESRHCKSDEECSDSGIPMGAGGIPSPTYNSNPLSPDDRVEGCVNMGDEPEAAAMFDLDALIRHVVRPSDGWGSP